MQTYVSHATEDCFLYIGENQSGKNVGISFISTVQDIKLQA